jgi:hypothetical protein
MSGRIRQSGLSGNWPPGLHVEARLLRPFKAKEKPRVSRAKSGRKRLGERRWWSNGLRARNGCGNVTASGNMLLCSAYLSRIALAVPRSTSSEPKIIPIAEAESEIIPITKAESEIVPVAKARSEIIPVAKSCKRPLELTIKTWAAILSGRIRYKQCRYCNSRCRENGELIVHHGCPPPWITAPVDHLTNCPMNRT